MEKRYFEITELRVEPEKEGKPRSIVGIAAPFNSRSVNLGGFVEEIAPGAFSRTLKERDQVALWSHDTSKPLGRKSRNTLILREEGAGLAVDITPPETTWGKDALIAVDRGDVEKMSFGFSVPEGGDEWRQDGDLIIRTLNDVDLMEVSLVVFPAYSSTNLATRDIYGDIPEIPASLCGATRAADTEDEQAQARLHIEKLKLNLMSINGGTK